MNLGKADLPKLEEMWEKYDEMKGQLAYRRYEILYRSQDTNVGGGKSNLPISPVENEVIALHKDKTYRNLSESITAIDDVYRNATPEQKAVIQYRYWGKDELIYEWQDIAHELTKQRTDDKIISRYAVIRIRNKVMQETAKRIGWINF